MRNDAATTTQPQPPSGGGGNESSSSLSKSLLFFCFVGAPWAMIAAVPNFVDCCLLMSRQLVDRANKKKLNF